MHSHSILLPPELLYQILLTVVTNSIHSIGTSCETQWDINVFRTLAEVSVLFEDVAHQLVGDVFGPFDEGGTRNLINDAQKLMHEFHQLIAPNAWSEVASNYPEEYPSHIFNAYALLTCASSLRRTAVGSSVSVFLTTQEAASMALREVKHWPIATREISTVLYERCEQEMALLTSGAALVDSCSRVMSILDELPVHFRPPDSFLSPKEREAKYRELILLLRNIEAAAVKFDCQGRFVEIQQPKVTQLPGVASTLRRIFCTFNDSRSFSCVPIRNILLHWVVDCSFLAVPNYGYPLSNLSVN